MRAEYHLVALVTAQRPQHRIFRVSNEEELYAVRHLARSLSQRHARTPVVHVQVGTDAARKLAPGAATILDRWHTVRAQARDAYVEYWRNRGLVAPNYASFVPDAPLGSALKQEGDVNYAIPARFLMDALKRDIPLRRFLTTGDSLIRRAPVTDLLWLERGACER